VDTGSSETFYRHAMLKRSIPLVLRETVHGEYFIVNIHYAITGNLCEDRSCGDAQGFLITLDD